MFNSTKVMASNIPTPHHPACCGVNPQIQPPTQQFTVFSYHHNTFNNHHLHY